MNEMDPGMFLRFMQTVALLCILAMAASIWPTDGDE